MHLDGPLLIVAGAGSGKTRVLTSRVANIILSKKYAYQTLWEQELVVLWASIMTSGSREEILGEKGLKCIGKS